MLYQELTGDWTSANDRTFRAQFNTFKRQATGWQYNLVCTQFNEPVWGRFVDYAVSSGVITPPTTLSDADLAPGGAWAPDRWAYINPAQDIAATGTEIALGLTPRSAAIAARGDNPEQIDETVRRRPSARESGWGSTSAPGRTAKGPTAASSRRRATTRPNSRSSSHAEVQRPPGSAAVRGRCRAPDGLPTRRARCGARRRMA